MKKTLAFNGLTTFFLDRASKSLYNTFWNQAENVRKKLALIFLFSNLFIRKKTLLKVNNRNTTKGFKIKQWRCSGVFIVKREDISHLFLMLLMLTLNRCLLVWLWLWYQCFFYDKVFTSCLHKFYLVYFWVF